MTWWRDLLVGQVAILDLELFKAAIVKTDRVPVLFLPLLRNLLLLDHHSVGLFFVALVALLGLEQLVFEVGDLHIALVVQLVDAPVENYLHPAQL